MSAAQERAAAHVERHSVWLHNSLRGGTGLALAVLVADLSAVQHSFWVVLGTLSVLRSNALSTGQNVVRSLLGTVAGFIVGAGLLALIGTNTTLLWFLLPPAVLLAGFAPAAISFAAGQAAFTLALVILFNILQPAGWRVGLVRVEDIAIGCAVSVLVGLFFWPRGAAAALGQALAEGYADAAGYLAAAVEFGLGRCDEQTRCGQPRATRQRARPQQRGVSRRVPAHLRERGANRSCSADVTSLVTGVIGLRLAGPTRCSISGSATTVAQPAIGLLPVVNSARARMSLQPGTRTSRPAWPVELPCPSRARAITPPTRGSSKRSAAIFRSKTAGAMQSRGADHLDG